MLAATGCGSSGSPKTSTGATRQTATGTPSGSASRRARRRDDRAPLAARRSLAASGLSEALVESDDQRDRVADLAACVAADGRRRTARERVRGGGARDDPVPA